MSLRINMTPNWGGKGLRCSVFRLSPGLQMGWGSPVAAFRFFVYLDPSRSPGIRHAPCDAFPYLGCRRCSSFPLPPSARNSVPEFRGIPGTQYSLW